LIPSKESPAHGGARDQYSLANMIVSTRVVFVYDWLLKPDQPRPTEFAPAMDEGAGILPDFPAVKGKPVHVAFDGGRMTSDAGILLLSAVEQRLRPFRQRGAAAPGQRSCRGCCAWPGRRSSAASTGRTHDRTRPKRHHRSFPLAPEGPSTHEKLALAKRGAIKERRPPIPRPLLAPGRHPKPYHSGHADSPCRSQQRMFTCATP